MSEKNTYWENQIKAFKQFQREIEGSTSSTAHTTYWLTGWDMGVKENQKKIADLEADLNASIDEVKDKDKRIAELEEAGKAYQTLAACYRIGSQPTEKLFKQLAAAKKALSEGGADE